MTTDRTGSVLWKQARRPFIFYDHFPDSRKNYSAAL